MKGQNRGDWTDVVGRSLHDAEEELPVGGWERLERELNVSLSVPVQNAKTNWIKYTAAAASILVCVLIGVQVLRMDQQLMEKGAVSVSEAAGSGQKDEMEALGGDVLPSFGGLLANVNSRQAPVEGRGAAVNRASVHSTNVEPGLREAVQGRAASFGEPTTIPASDGFSDVAPEISLPENTSVNTVVGSPEEKKTPLHDVESGTAEKMETMLPGEERAGYGKNDYDALFAEALPASRKGGSVSLFASGALGSSGGSAAGASFWPINISSTTTIQPAYPGYSFDHKQPLSFGVSYRKEFKYGLSLETGLNYTLLRSDVAVPGGTKDVRQYLHLIGIPLRANWQFLRAGRFSMYVGAGGMAEKCISARFGDEKISEKKVQWSLSGTVGAQYLLGRSVGIYFEPSVSHYLTHTSLRTAYTDSSAILDLRLGLRFTY